MPRTLSLALITQSLRSLRKTPAFTATGVLMVGLVMGLLSAIFSVVHTVLLQALPFAEPKALFYVSGTAPSSQFSGELGVSDEFLLHYQQRSKLLAQLASYQTFTNSVQLDQRVERLELASGSTDLFKALGTSPQLGRLPSTADTTDKLVVVLSDHFWNQWFGRDPNVIGKTVIVFGEPREIIAVMPARFVFPRNNTELWLIRGVDVAEISNQLGRFGSGLLVRSKAGVSKTQIQQELQTLVAELPGRFGGDAAYAELIGQYRVMVHSLSEQLLGPVAGPLWLMFASVALLLLIACANLAGLFQVRAEARQREMAVRYALGSGRGNLLALILAEALIIALAAAAFGLFLAALILPQLLQFAPSGVLRLDSAQIGPATIWASLGVALLVGLISGFYAALRASRPDLERLRGGVGSYPAQQRFRQALVVGQTALALMLLIGAGLLMRTAIALNQVDPGFDARDVFTFQFAPDQKSQPDAKAWALFHQDFLQRLAALPGVQSVGLVDNVPLNEGTDTVRARTESMTVPLAEGAVLNVTVTAGDYFRSMGIPVLAGRVFDARDHAGSGNIVLSKSAADKLWPGQDPIGKRLQREGVEQWATVIGVVGAVRQSNFWTEPEPLYYEPLTGPTPETSWRITSPAYVIKSQRAEAIAADVRALIRSVAPSAPMYRQFTLEQLVQISMAHIRFTLATLATAAAMALVLGVIGLYSVLSYLVAQRTREIGLRMALGAPAPHVRRAIVWQGLRVVLLGAAIGVLLAAFASRALASLLYGVATLDSLTFIATTAGMLGFGALASYLPARRASLMSPMNALRSD